MIETDAPWLAPVPYRGKPNEPAFVSHVAEAVAMLRGTVLKPLLSKPLKTFIGCFRLRTREPLEAIRLERDKRKRQAFIRREQDILSVCESLMAEKGVRQVSVDKIAARTGIGKGTIYKHFDSKRDMLIAIAARYFAMLIELLVDRTTPCAVSDWIEAQLYSPRRSLLIHELVATLEDDSEALNKIQDAGTRCGSD